MYWSTLLLRSFGPLWFRNNTPCIKHHTLYIIHYTYASRSTVLSLTSSSPPLPSSSSPPPPHLLPPSFPHLSPPPVPLLPLPSPFSTGSLKRRLHHQPRPPLRRPRRSRIAGSASIPVLSRRRVGEAAVQAGRRSGPAGCLRPLGPLGHRLERSRHPLFPLPLLLLPPLLPPPPPPPLSKPS